MKQLMTLVLVLGTFSVSTSNAHPTRSLAQENDQHIFNSLNTAKIDFKHKSALDTIDPHLFKPSQEAYHPTGFRF